MPRLIGRVVFASWLGLGVALSGATGARADEAQLVAEAAALYTGPETTLERRIPGALVNLSESALLTFYCASKTAKCNGGQC